MGQGYSVVATMGHIKDLPKNILGVDVKNHFEPQYDFVVRKKDAIDEIKKMAKKAGQIYLATDPDREGEAIAAHVAEMLPGKETRIVFHEITKEAVDEALKNPRKVDKNLVDAQIARRVLDRLVGYKLSPLLWKKVRRGLSAGRVQTVAVRLIVEREREIEKFKKAEYWEIFCDVKTRNIKSKEEIFTVKLIKIGENNAEVKEGKKAGKIVSDLKKSKYSVLDVRKREVRKNPYPPFTTSTLAQAGARLFGWSAKRTMSIAQRLYESGYITYHRTDSTAIAKGAQEKVREFIKSKYGREYLPVKAKLYKVTSKVAQEAHEAIRPTNLENSGESIKSQKYGNDASALYDLIWRRFVACQMTASVYDETTIEVIAKNGQDYLLRASGQIIKFEGWKKVLGSKKDLEEVVRLPEVKINYPLDLIKVSSEQKWTEPQPRYNEASLIKTLEKLGIGRPSTYAPIISTIQIRNYVEKKEGKFFPTPVGVAVNDFLLPNFKDLFDYQFTAEMEDDLDKVADGKVSWRDSISKFWNPFSTKLSSVEEHSKRVKIEVEKLGKPCPECGKGELVVRIGRFGKFVSCSRFPDCKHTEKFVDKVGMKCPKCGIGDVIIKKTGRGKRFFGCSRYPKCDFASWRNPKANKEISNINKDSDISNDNKKSYVNKVSNFSKNSNDIDESTDGDGGK